MNQKNFLITCTINNRKSEIQLIKHFSKIAAVREAISNLDLSQFSEDEEIDIKIKVANNG